MYALNASFIHHQSAALTRSHVQKRNLEAGVCTADWHASLGLDLAVLQMLNGVKPERETWSSAAACHRH